jgi:hypothetical protein
VGDLAAGDAVVAVGGDCICVSTGESSIRKNKHILAGRTRACFLNLEETKRQSIASNYHIILSHS